MTTPQDIIYTLAADPSPICLRTLFGNDRPVELEIGTGKGGFLLQRARCCPQRNFLGIEWANKYFRYAADRMSRWGVTNVRLLRTDAKIFVIRRLAAGSLRALHVYHPDPWPKKRHHKRRLFDEPFSEAACRALQPGAEWSIQTDHQEYFRHIRELLSARPELEETLYVDDNNAGDSGFVETNFQIKYRRVGRPIYRLVYRRRFV